MSASKLAAVPKKLITVARAVLACVALGASPGLVAFIFDPRMSARDLGMSAFQGFIYAACIGGPCWAVIPAVMCSIDSRPFWTRALAIVPVLGVFCVLGCFAANLILTGLHLVDRAHFADTFWWSLRTCMLVTFTFGLINLGVSTLQSRLASAKEELHKRQIAEERERKTANRVFTPISCSTR